MPTTHSAAPELASLLDGSSAGELIPELARHGLQQLIELEVAAFLGADRHERTDERLGYRNGYRSGTLTTQVGDLALQIPKLRAGSFIPNCRRAACAPIPADRLPQLTEIGLRLLARRGLVADGGLAALPQRLPPGPHRALHRAQLHRSGTVVHGSARSGPGQSRPKLTPAWIAPDSYAPSPQRLPWS